MIIRRKHTANFTTIGNALFDDERLAADEVGILAFLLRQHHDWEVRRPALMRRWSLGSVSMKRIINNWMRYGWCQAKKTRLSNGTFSIVYEIRDEPGPELTEDQIRDALSLVSSEASEDESEAGNNPDQPHVGEHPPPCQPGVVDQGVVGEGVALKKESLNTDSSKTDSHQTGRAFSVVLAKWPSDHVISSFACEQLHAAMPEAMQIAADNGVRPYLDDCKANNRKYCDLATFYRERRWERFAPKAGPSLKTHHAMPHTPQWHRWRDYYQKTGGPYRFMETQARNNNGYTVPSEWPPAIQHGPKTDPPSQESKSA